MNIEQREFVPSPEEKVWVGENITLLKNFLINPHNSAVIRVKGNVGTFPEELTYEEEEKFSLSMRSRYAQIGLHPGVDAAKFALEAYFSANDIDDVEFQLPITNLSEAPIFLPRGSELLRFYTPPAEFIKNGELINLVDSGAIKINGKKDKDWKIVPQVGLALKVKDEGRGFIPKSHEPISISSEEKEYRSEVDRFLRPVSERRNPTTPCLWIGETCELNLNGLVTAEIEREAYSGFEGNSPIGAPWEHIDSRLIDPSTGWPVRVEIYSPTAGQHVADWVVFKFFKQ